ncbi:MAG: urease accessory protein UreE [Paracoccaceae bacterium]|nr:urease accessory protein UreE [Paracoccaceae bacterium]MDE2674259.1 urease accessory protein UreE [Paracoccaceae bacterium]MDE2739714.1 urease accessory protein UreE [Paracoccaceae bacterium]MYF46092.1 urease accessory protein UreE [Paracoccaceae bacterium]MYG10113.1 urease accessory protein UreE [Paracoccaceae bacterium]
MSLVVSRNIKHAKKTDDIIVMDYEERFLRRKILTSENGIRFQVDLAKTTSLNQHDAFVLEDGRLVGVVPADEDLLEVKGDLVRLAWHIGNRHAPCQIESGRLLIQYNHVIKAMLLKLGAIVTCVNEPFTPEGGAYGNTRTHAH